MSCHITTRQLPGEVLLVVMHGTADLSGAESFRRAFDQLLENGCFNLIVSLEGLKFIDASGLGVLIDALRRIRDRHGDLSLVVTNPHFKKILEITGLDRMFKVFKNVNEAFESMEGTVVKRVRTLKTYVRPDVKKLVRDNPRKPAPLRT